MAESFVLPQKFHYVLLTLAGLNLQVWATALSVSRIRGELFTQQFMDEHFGELHRAEMKEKVERGGSPDSGSGPYSRKLSYG